MSRQQLHLDTRAEQEATDIASQFMDSSDVIGDMSRAYNTDFSSVSIHTDADAAQRTSSAGVDAFASGKDIYFGRGAFNQSDPASRGLLAHELTHTMQQGAASSAGAGSGFQPVQSSAPSGAEQGGLISLFRSLFQKRRDPQLISGPGTGPVMEDRKKYQNTQSLALGKMVKNAANGQQDVLQTPEMRKAAVDDFNQNFSQTLSEYNDDTFTSMGSAFRGNGSGELNTFNTVLKANMGGIPEALLEMMKDEGTTVTDEQTGKTRTVYSDGAIDRCLNYVADQVKVEGSPLHEMMVGSMKSFKGSTHFAGKPELQSKYIMNNLMLRDIAPAIMFVNKDLSHALMQAVNTGSSAACIEYQSMLTGYSDDAPDTLLRDLKSTDVSYNRKADPNNAQRQAYIALSNRDKTYAQSDEERAAMIDYINSSSAINRSLREGKSIEELKNSRDDSEQQAGADREGMEKLFNRIPGLSENLTTFKGVDDHFLKSILQKAGVDVAALCVSGDPFGTLDYDELEETGGLNKLTGLTYVDEAYESTTTNRSFAEYWGSQNKVNMLRLEMNKRMRAMNLSPEEQKELSANNEENLLHMAAEEFSGGHVMVIDCPAGTKGIFADMFRSEGTHQNEVTLDRGLTYRINKVRKINKGKYELHVQVLTKGKKREAEK